VNVCHPNLACELAMPARTVNLATYSITTSMRERMEFHKCIMRCAAQEAVRGVEEQDAALRPLGEAAVVGAAPAGDAALELGVDLLEGGRHRHAPGHREGEAVGLVLVEVRVLPQDHHLYLCVCVCVVRVCVCVCVSTTRRKVEPAATNAPGRAECN
jgi:hypothetical protein